MINPSMHSTCSAECQVAVRLLFEVGTGIIDNHGFWRIETRTIMNYQ